MSGSSSSSGEDQRITTEEQKMLEIFGIKGNTDPQRRKIVELEFDEDEDDEYAGNEVEQRNQQEASNMEPEFVKTPDKIQEIIQLLEANGGKFRYIHTTGQIYTLDLEFSKDLIFRTVPVKNYGTSPLGENRGDRADTFGNYVPVRDKDKENQPVQWIAEEDLDNMEKAVKLKSLQQVFVYDNLVRQHEKDNTNNAKPSYTVVEKLHSQLRAKIVQESLRAQIAQESSEGTAQAAQAQRERIRRRQEEGEKIQRRAQRKKEEMEKKNRLQKIIQDIIKVTPEQIREEKKLAATYEIKLTDDEVKIWVNFNSFAQKPEREAEAKDDGTFIEQDQKHHVNPLNLMNEIEAESTRQWDNKVVRNFLTKVDEVSQLLGDYMKQRDILEQILEKELTDSERRAMSRKLKGYVEAKYSKEDKAAEAKRRKDAIFTSKAQSSLAEALQKNVVGGTRNQRKLAIAADVHRGNTHILQPGYLGKDERVKVSDLHQSREQERDEKRKLEKKFLIQGTEPRRTVATRQALRPKGAALQKMEIYKLFLHTIPTDEFPDEKIRRVDEIFNFFPGVNDDDALKCISETRRYRDKVGRIIQSATAQNQQSALDLMSLYLSGYVDGKRYYIYPGDVDSAASVTKIARTSHFSTQVKLQELIDEAFEERERIVDNFIDEGLKWIYWNEQRPARDDVEDEDKDVIRALCNIERRMAAYLFYDLPPNDIYNWCRCRFFLMRIYLMINELNDDTSYNINTHEGGMYHGAGWYPNHIFKTDANLLLAMRQNGIYFENCQYNSSIGLFDRTYWVMPEDMRQGYSYKPIQKRPHDWLWINKVLQKCTGSAGIKLVDKPKNPRRISATPAQIKYYEHNWHQLKPKDRKAFLEKLNRDGLTRVEVPGDQTLIIYDGVPHYEDRFNCLKERLASRKTEPLKGDDSRDLVWRNFDAETAKKLESSLLPCPDTAETEEGAAESYDSEDDSSDPDYESSDGDETEDSSKEPSSESEASSDDSDENS